jgi:hypothetical protein
MTWCKGKKYASSGIIHAGGMGSTWRGEDYKEGLGCCGRCGRYGEILPKDVRDVDQLPRPI